MRGSSHDLARALNVSTGTIRKWARKGEILKHGKDDYEVDIEEVKEDSPPPSSKSVHDLVEALEHEGFNLDEGGPDRFDDDDDVEDIDELIERRRKTFQRTRKHNERRRAIVRIRRDGPFGIMHMGDPHLDDDGCDWESLLRDVKIVTSTPHLYAGNVGDTINNWVGKLIGKYKQQSSTEDEALRLGRWLFRRLPWDYVLLGNHDHWHQGGHLFRSFSSGAQIATLADHEARIEYEGPAGVPFRLNVRHDFKGHSMWNKTHGPSKRARMRPWGDLYACGHKHTWGVQSDESQPGKPTWVVRLRGYKLFDEYAEAKDFPEDEYGHSLTTIINPDHPHPGERCKIYHDAEEAADFLHWLRKKR